MSLDLDWADWALRSLLFVGGWMASPFYEVSFPLVRITGSLGLAFALKKNFEI